MPKGLNTEINYVVFGVCIIIKLYRWLTICAKCVYYKGAINSIIYYERPFTSVTGAFSHYIAFVIELACGFIAKISGDALVIFFVSGAFNTRYFIFGGCYEKQKRGNSFVYDAWLYRQSVLLFGEHRCGSYKCTILLDRYSGISIFYKRYKSHVHVAIWIW